MERLNRFGGFLRDSIWPVVLTTLAILGTVAAVVSATVAAGWGAEKLLTAINNPLYSMLAAFGLSLLIVLSTACCFERGRRGIGWAWNNLGSAVATFGVVAMLYAISLLLAYAFLQLDYFFSRPLAGDVIPPNVTQAVAWGTRLFTLVAGSLAIYFHENNMPSWRRGALWLGAFGAVLLMLHAYGVSAKIMEGQYAIAGASSSDESAIVVSISDQIADIDAEIALAETTKDDALRVAQETIEGVKDPVAGLSAADNETIRQANDDKEAALAVFTAEVKRLQDEKKLLRSSQATASGNEAVAKAMVNTFNPLFTFLARVTTLNFNPAEQPPEGHKYVWGAVFFTLFFGFGEIALIFCLTSGFAALKVVSERKKAIASGEYKDPVRVEAGKKAANTRNRRKRQSNKIELRAETLAPSWAHAVKLARNTTWTAENIAKTAFKGGNMEEVIAALWKAEKARDPEKVETPYITDEQVRLVKRQDKGLPVVAKPNSVDIIHPDPKTTNGSGTPLEQSEPEQSDDDASQRDSV